MEDFNENTNSDKINRLLIENKKMKRTIRWLSIFVVVVLIIQLYNLVAQLF